MKYLVTNIKFDTDGEQIENLSGSMTIEVPDGMDAYETEQYISDEISNRTGWCHEGFSLTPELIFE